MKTFRKESKAVNHVLDLNNSGNHSGIVALWKSQWNISFEKDGSYHLNPLATSLFDLQYLPFCFSDKNN